jgi:hypothetical protein
MEVVMEFYDYFDRHSQYILVGRDQYQVLLDDQDHPKKMWCTALFQLADRVNLGDGVMYQIIWSAESELPGIFMYTLRKV